MILPKNICELAEKNRALLEKINFNPMTDDPLEMCSPEAYAATDLFTSEIIDEIFSNLLEKGTQERAGSTISRAIGMILVRPDMMHKFPAFEDFISARFTLIESQTVRMNTYAYWEIYKHDYYRPETLHSRLSRAALYIGSECRILIFRSTSPNKIEESTADFTFKNLKGRQGVYKPGTLRGDIVYLEAIKLGFHDYQIQYDRQLATAIDPFGVYAMLSSLPEGDHTELVHPRLFYTGVGVHVPNAVEIESDMKAVRQFL